MTEEDREMDLALAECEQENRLLRARNERLSIEVQLLTEAVRDMSKPKREWVPVSDEIKKGLQDWQSKYNIIDYIEVWLKEKNYD